MYRKILLRTPRYRYFLYRPCTARSPNQRRSPRGPALERIGCVWRAPARTRPRRCFRINEVPYDTHFRCPLGHHAIFAREASTADEHAVPRAPTTGGMPCSGLCFFLAIFQLLSYQIFSHFTGTRFAGHVSNILTKCVGLWRTNKTAGSPSQRPHAAAISFGRATQCRTLLRKSRRTVARRRRQGTQAVDTTRSWPADFCGPTT